jgi:hypothetical protein
MMPGCPPASTCFPPAAAARDRPLQGCPFTSPALPGRRLGSVAYVRPAYGGQSGQVTGLIPYRPSEIPYRPSEHGPTALARRARASGRRTPHGSPIAPPGGPPPRRPRRVAGTRTYGKQGDEHAACRVMRRELRGPGSRPGGPACPARKLQRAWHRSVAFTYADLRGYQGESAEPTVQPLLRRARR